jgi:hypothetical protein
MPGVRVFLNGTYRTGCPAHGIGTMMALNPDELIIGSEDYFTEREIVIIGAKIFK